jgi:hypothetical protein
MRVLGVVPVAACPAGRGRIGPLDIPIAFGAIGLTVVTLCWLRTLWRLSVMKSQLDLVHLEIGKLHSEIGKSRVDVRVLQRHLLRALTAPKAETPAGAHGEVTEENALRLVSSSPPLKPHHPTANDVLAG